MTQSILSLSDLFRASWNSFFVCTRTCFRLHKFSLVERSNDKTHYNCHEQGKKVVCNNVLRGIWNGFPRRGISYTTLALAHFCWKMFVNYLICYAKYEKSHIHVLFPWCKIIFEFIRVIGIAFSCLFAQDKMHLILCWISKVIITGIVACIQAWWSFSGFLILVTKSPIF